MSGTYGRRECVEDLVRAVKHLRGEGQGEAAGVTDAAPSSSSSYKGDGADNAGAVDESSRSFPLPLATPLHQEFVTVQQGRTVQMIISLMKSAAQFN